MLIYGIVVAFASPSACDVSSSCFSDIGCLSEEVAVVVAEAETGTAVLPNLMDGCLLADADGVVVCVSALAAATLSINDSSSNEGAAAAAGVD